MKKRFKQVIIIALITYMLIELMCFAIIKTGYIAAKLPHFFSDPKDSLVFPFTYADINSHWGVWHYNYPVKTPYGCIITECVPNSVGARDKERTIKSNATNRVIVLGDSFMEGFGVNTEERVSDLLEKNTGREFLNFACADMGSAQEYLIYKHLASAYDHNTVLIGILPANDFLNDNMAFDSIQTPLRYKPYWTADGKITYYANDMHKSQFNYEAFKKYKSTFKYRLRYFFENTTCWFNIIYYINKKGPAAGFVKTSTKSGLPYSGYYDYTDDDLARLKKSLLAIRKLSAGKKMIIFTIPVKEDFLRSDIAPPLVNELNDFSKENDIEYIDLLIKKTEEDPRNFYFDCDEHWNANGNKWAFDKLISLFK